MRFRDHSGARPHSKGNVKLAWMPRPFWTSALNIHRVTETLKQEDNGNHTSGSKGGRTRISQKHTHPFYLWLLTQRHLPMTFILSHIHPIRTNITDLSAIVRLEGMLQAGRPGFNSRQGEMMGFFLFATASRPALVSTQPPIQGVLGFLPLRYSDRGVKLTTHLHLVPRLRIRGAISTLSQCVFMASCLIN
jgi:hypothetical protein